MELQNQVTSLELSKMLKELGFPQDSLFYWVVNAQTAFREPRVLLNGVIKEWNQKQAKAFQYEILCSAYTVAELGELLPSKLYIKKRTLYNENYKHKSGMFFAGYQNEKDEKDYIGEIDFTECDARAKLLIHLKENNLL
jgi:hypothetical protein